MRTVASQITVNGQLVERHWI